MARIEEPDPFAYSQAQLGGTSTRNPTVVSPNKKKKKAIDRLVEQTEGVAQLARAPVIKKEAPPGPEQEGFMGAIGRHLGGAVDWLKEHPIKAQYSPGIEGAMGSTPSQFGFDTGPLVKSAQRKKLLKKWEGMGGEKKWTDPQTGEVFELPKDMKFDKAGKLVPTKGGKAASRTWSKSSDYAREVMAELRKEIQLNPNLAKSKETLDAILQDENIATWEKDEILRQVTGKNLLTAMIEAGMLGEGGT